MAVSKDKFDLQWCYFCKICLKAWIPAISANRKNFSYKNGGLLFREGEEVKGIYFVSQGRVKVHNKWSNGKELILRFTANGTIVGHRGLGGDIFYPVSATDLESTTVCFIDLDFFMTSLKVNHNFTLSLLNFFAEELKESEKWMRNMAHMSVKGRVAYALLLLKKAFGVSKDGHLDIKLSRQDLASYVGATYETVFRTLGELANENIISLSGKNIIILKTETLVSLSYKS